jgi:cytochrome c oxidase cbb3-type subunit 1
MHPYYIIRALGGILYLGGTLIMAFNLWKTVRDGQPVAVAAGSVTGAVSAEAAE